MAIRVLQRFHEYLALYDSQPEIRRFWIGWSTTLVLAVLSWDLALLWDFRGCQGFAPEWIVNHTTYGLMHHVFWPPAAGLIAASVNWTTIRRSSMPARAIGVVLLLLGLYITIGSISPGSTLSPYELKGGCGLNGILQELRQSLQKPGVKPDLVREQTKDEVDCYDAQRTLRSWRDLWKRGSITAFTAFLISTALIWTIAAVIWWGVFVRGSKRQESIKRVRMGWTMCLLLTWLPCRVYADWYLNFPLTDKWIEPHFYAGIILSAMFIVWCISVDVPVRLVKYMWILSTCITMGGAIVLGGVDVTPQIIQDVLIELPPEMKIALTAVLMILATDIARRYASPLYD